MTTDNINYFTYALTCQFCGSTVAVVSLLAPCVARFRLDEARDQCVDVLIRRRSLYIMK